MTNAKEDQGRTPRHVAQPTKFVGLHCHSGFS